MTEIPACVGGVPNVWGSEKLIASAINRNRVFLPDSSIDWDKVESVCSITPHMHQTTLPNGGKELCHCVTYSDVIF